MRELSYGQYRIIPSPAKTRKLYLRRGPHMQRCSCPGCQNFFKSIIPYRDELAAALAPMGIAWDKPDSITVKGADHEEVFYIVNYSLYAAGEELPAKWRTEKTDLGTINLPAEGGIYNLNEKMSFSFTPAGRKKLRLEVTAELPWLMETLNCVYDPSVIKVNKDQPLRIQRIYRAAKHIIDSIKEEV